MAPRLSPLARTSAVTNPRQPFQNLKSLITIQYPVLRPLVAPSAHRDPPRRTSIRRLEPRSPAGQNLKLHPQLRESWIRGCPDSRTIPLVGLLDYEDTRLKTSSRVRKGLFLGV